MRSQGSKLRNGDTATAEDQILHAGISPNVIDGPTRAAPFVLWSNRLPDTIPEYELVGVASSTYVQ